MDVTSSGLFEVCLNLDGMSLFVFFELENITTGQRFLLLCSHNTSNELSSFKLTLRLQETKSMSIAGLKTGQSSNGSVPAQMAQGSVRTF